MYQPLRLFLAGFLMIGLVTPQLASAQEDDRDDEETVIETEDGRRIVIIEEDTDGDRPRVERRVIRRHAPARDLLDLWHERAAPRNERRGEIIFRDEDGNERHFTMDGDYMQWRSNDDAAVTDTTIDGQRVIIIRTPDGNEEIIELDGMMDHAFSFIMPDFNLPHFEHDFGFEMPEGNEMRLRMFGNGGSNAFAFGPNFMHLEGMMGASSETRREMMELERRSVEIASQLREEQSAELERELDEVLELLFDLRGQARAERADRMEEQAEELRQEAQELRESLNERNRDRSNIIEERKRELLGERGHGW